MAPGAAPHAVQLDHDFSERLPHLNAFEGPEKKLLITFKPTSSFITSGTDQLQERLPQFQASSEFPHSLRMLPRKQIQSILDAAACTILSVTSNDYCDAYLLSESSLFVSDTCFMIKTCGTTTLLLALPLMLKLAYEHVDLCVTAVQFSRVSYIFPSAQKFPHDSFDNEVAFLDRELRTFGQVMETGKIHGSQWHMYHAVIDKPLINQDWIPTYEVSQIAKSVSHIADINSQSLEIYMFDLDPSTMNQFMFQDRQQIIGTDDPKQGTTFLTNILSLLPSHALIDAFNFEPCGYSMNALLGANYCTIHVSPEPEASYVSFETKIPSESIPDLVSSVVQAFAPGRFKVAITTTAISSTIHGDNDQKSPWNQITNLLRTHGYEGLQLPGSDLLNCLATVASYYSTNPQRTSKNVKILENMPSLDNPRNHLHVLANLYNAAPATSSEWIDNFQRKVVEKCLSKTPFFLVDLNQVLNNTTELQKLVRPKGMQLRYAVRCNGDEAIIALLNRMNALFEASSVKEIEALEQVGVPKQRIELVTPVLTPPILAKLSAVGTIALFDCPTESVLRRIEENSVSVAIQVMTVDRDEIEMKVTRIIQKVKQVTSIAIDINPPLNQNNEPTTEGMIGKYADTITRCLAVLPDYLKETVKVSLAESFWCDSDMTNDLFPSTLDRNLNAYLPHGRGSIDVSRLIVSNAISLFTQVIGRRYRETMLDNRNVGTYYYYLNDGVYGAFSSVLMDTHPGRKSYLLKPRALKNYDEQMPCILFGPTCDALDRVWVGELPVLDVGDWVLFRDMGAYGASMVSGFNGFGREYGVQYVAHCM